MKRSLSIVSMVLLMAGVIGCAPVTPGAQEATSTPEPASTEPFYPLTTQTGIQPVDRVLDAVANGDMQSLRALVEFTSAECTHTQGFGGPPKCREGEAEGTPVEALAFLGSEGGHLRNDELANWTGIQATGIYAMYEVNTTVVSSEQYYPVGNYTILFIDEPNQIGTALRLGESGIVRVDTIFDVSAQNLNAMVEREALHVLLAPKS